VSGLSDLVRGLGIGKYFSEVYSSALMGYEKPNVQIYRKVLEKLDSNRDVTMIGDNFTRMFKVRAGIKAILVRKENSGNYPSIAKI